MTDKTLPHDHNQSLEHQFDHMPSVENFQMVADIFKQMGDGSRVRIFWLLCHCEECVTNLSTMVDMSSPAVSHHLRQLKASGLIVSRREGKEVYYRAADTETAQLLHHMIEKVVQIACPSKIGKRSLLMEVIFSEIPGDSRRDSVLHYAKTTYGTTPEQLWRSHPNFLVLRHKSNQKWYGLIMDVRERKAPSVR